MDNIIHAADDVVPNSAISHLDEVPSSSSDNVGSHPIPLATPPPSGGSADNLIPGSDAHRDQRWLDYQTNPDNAGWSYDRWRRNYELNQTRARDAQVMVEKYAMDLGWGTTQQRAIPVGDLETRRLDILDPGDPANGIAPRGIEYKGGGYFYRDPDILLELKKDAYLVRVEGYDIEWVFEVTEGVSQPLIDDLIDAGIRVRINNVIAVHSDGIVR
jgi:hypothetical protein